MAGCVAQPSGEVCVYQNIDLARSVADQRGTHQSEDVQNSLMTQIPSRPPRESGAPNAGQQKRKLRGTAQYYPESHAAHGTDSRKTPQRKSGNNRKNVEGRRRDRGNRETMIGVLYPLRLSREGEQQQEGKHGADQRSGELRLPPEPYRVKSRRKEIDDRRAQEHPERTEATGDRENHGACDIRKLARFGVRLRGEITRERGYEGGGKSALGEKLTREVGDAKTEHVGVVGRARSEQPAQHAFPYRGP